MRRERIQHRPLGRVLADITPHEPELRWRSVRERVSVGGDRTPRSIRTEIVLEAAADGADRHIALHHNDSGSLPELLSVWHCRVGRTRVEPEDGIYALELLFDHPLQCGETYVLEYEFGHTSRSPATGHRRVVPVPGKGFSFAGAV